MDSIFFITSRCAFLIKSNSSTTIVISLFISNILTVADCSADVGLYTLFARKPMLREPESYYERYSLSGAFDFCKRQISFIYSWSNFSSLSKKTSIFKYAIIIKKELLYLYPSTLL